MKQVEITNLCKNYGKFAALDNVSLTMEKGRIIGLLGKNGAGKSTLMRSMLGFLKYKGQVVISGVDVNNNPQQITSKVAFIPDVSGLDNDLTVSQTIDFVAGANPVWNDATAHRLLERSELPLDKKVKKLSKGMKTKLYLLLTLALDVDLLLLDEPTLGLDIVFRKEFFNRILGEFYGEEKTILISTHQVEEVEHILDEIIFIDEGRILLHQPVEDLKSSWSIVEVPIAKEAELMAHKPRYVVKSLGLISGLLPAGVEIADATYKRPSLSDIFYSFVGGNNEAV